MMKPSLVLVCGLALTALSCEKIKEAPPKLGPPTSATAIQDEFSKVEGHVNPIGAKVGDALALLMNISAENAENVQNLASMRREVLARTNVADGIEFQIRNKDFKIENDNVTETRNEVCVMKVTTQKITYVCPSSNPENGAQQAFGGYATAQLDQMMKQKTAASDEDDGPVDSVIDRRYYNLQTVNEQADPPQVVRERANCSGLNPCKINLTHVQFDEVERYASGKMRHKRWHYALTPDLSYLGTEGIEYQTCLSESVAIQDRPVLLKQCLFVYDLLKN